MVLYNSLYGFIQSWRKMNIKKCDSCNKILTKEIDYFEIDEVTFNKGNNPGDSIRMYLASEGEEKAYDMKQSWCHYTDIDFCSPCFSKLGLDKILLKKTC